MDRYFNQIYQPLRFYTSLSEKISARHAKLKYNNIPTLIASRTSLVPFELFKPITSDAHWFFTETTLKIYVVNSLTGAIRDVSKNLTKKYGKRIINPGDYEMYITYPGLSEIAPLGQGRYYIHAVLNDTDNWYSDDFLCGFYDTITISFKNSKSFGNLWMYDWYWKASYQGRTYDTGEYSEFSVSRKDINNFDKFSYRRKDKIHACSMFIDANGLDAMNMAAMCSDVLITDEIGIQWPVEILELEPAPQGLSYYHNLIMKYRVIGDSIISVNTQNISLAATQSGVPDEVEEPPVIINEGTLTHGGEELTHGGEILIH